jgi:hypothetical protein
MSDFYQYYLRNKQFNIEDPFIQEIARRDHVREGRAPTVRRIRHWMYRFEHEAARWGTTFDQVMPLDPPRPEPPQTGIHGPLRHVPGTGFRDDRGPYLPLGCHHMHGLRLHKVNPNASRDQLAYIKGHYDVVRTIMCCGWYDNFWGDEGVYPIDFVNRSGNVVEEWDDYDTVVDSYFQELHNLNLRLNITFGDGQMFRDQATTIQFMRRVGRIASKYKNLIALIEWNEAYQNYWTSPSPAMVMEALQAFLNEYRQPTIKAISDEGEEVFDINRWAWDISNAHIHRGGGSADKIRHRWVINYTGERTPPRIYEGWETEPVGPGTSVGVENNVEALVLCAAAMLSTGWGFNYICGDGIKWTRPIQNNPGFHEVSKVRKLLPPDIMTYRGLIHGGRTEALISADFSSIERVDQQFSSSGKVFGLAYSNQPVTNGILRVRRPCELTVINPVSHAVIADGTWNANEVIRVSYDRGVIFKGKEL